MKIALYSPYLDTGGGGEKYMLTIAEILSQRNEVFILLDKHLAELGEEKIKSKIKSLHDIDLTKATFICAPIGKGSSIFKRLFFLRKFNYFFYLTDGSIFYSTAKNSIIHFQVPFENREEKGIWGNIKLSSWKMAIYNSLFTKNLVEKHWLLKGEVIYPPVSVNLFKSLNKKNQIVSVGRFFGFLQDKKHKLLINIFKDIVRENKQASDWSLHLAGAAEQGDDVYVEELKRLAQGSKIFFYPNASISTLQKLYGESKIYWHAMGFGESDPKKYEHFGITTVEAMSAGCIPVVIAKGGLPEIVEDNISGFLWKDLEECKNYTMGLIKNDQKIKNMRKNSIQKAGQFDKKIFIDKITTLVN